MKITEEEKIELFEKWYKDVCEMAGYIFHDDKCATHYAFLAGYNSCENRLKCHAKQQPTAQA